METAIAQIREKRIDPTVHFMPNQFARRQNAAVKIAFDPHSFQRFDHIRAANGSVGQKNDFLPRVVQLAERVEHAEAKPLFFIHDAPQIDDKGVV